MSKEKLNNLILKKKSELNKCIKEIKKDLENLTKKEEYNYWITALDFDINNYLVRAFSYKNYKKFDFPEIQKQYEEMLPEIRKYLPNAEEELFPRE